MTTLTKRRENVEVADDALADFCRRHHISVTVELPQLTPALEKCLSSLDAE